MICYWMVLRMPAVICSLKWIVTFQWWWGGVGTEKEGLQWLGRCLVSSLSPDVLAKDPLYPEIGIWGEILTSFLGMVIVLAGRAHGVPTEADPNNNQKDAFWSRHLAKAAGTIFIRPQNREGKQRSDGRKEEAIHSNTTVLQGRLGTQMRALETRSLSELKVSMCWSISTSVLQ